MRTPLAAETDMSSQPGTVIKNPTWAVGWWRILLALLGPSVRHPPLQGPLLHPVPRVTNQWAASALKQRKGAHAARSDPWVEPTLPEEGEAGVWSRETRGFLSSASGTSPDHSGAWFCFRVVLVPFGPSSGFQPSAIVWSEHGQVSARDWRRPAKKR